MKRLSVLLLLTALVFSCKKNKDKNCSTDMASVAGGYKITAYTYKASPSAPEQDYFSVFTDPCERDDIITLNVNGNYTYSDAGVTCSPPGDATGTWSISGTTMNLDGDLSTVESFDCKNLVLSNSDVLTTGDKMKVTLTRQ